MSDPYGYSKTQDAPQDGTRERRAPRAQRPGTLSEKDRNLGMWVHLVGVISAFTGLLGLVATLIIWIMNKDDSKFIDECGRESMNFQVSVIIYGVALALMWITIIGIPFAIIGALGLWIASIVMPIIAGLKAGEGKSYQYPLTIRMF